MKTDLVAFLEARLDEEQAALESIEDHSEPWRGEWVIKAGTLYTYNGWCLAVMHRDHPWNPRVLEHVVRWDPARVLAEIAAKRGLLRWCAEEVLVGVDLAGVNRPGWVNRVSPERARDVQIFTAVVALKALAAPYADHEDFDESWRT